MPVDPAANPALTVCVIARNEEATIGQALASLFMHRDDAPPTAMRDEQGRTPIWDELVVVLAGTSTDNTEIIAKSFGATVAIYPPPDGAWPLDGSDVEARHYGEARQACEDLAHGRYVLWIDADEELISGHDLIRRIVNQGRLPGVRPYIAPLNGGPLQSRQELLHRRGQYRWHGAIHEYLVGIAVPTETGIVYRELERPDGDRPHGDMFTLLRREMGDSIDGRNLFYLAREHMNVSADAQANGDGPKHWAEAIALGRLFLETDGMFVERRSQMCVYMAQCWIALGDVYQARRCYLDAIREYGNWAEPYYGLAVLHRDLNLFREAIAWGSAACVFEPEGVSVNLAIYAWKRFDVMAYCLAAVGRYEQAAAYYAKVQAAHPNPTTDANLRRVTQMAKGVAPDTGLVPA